MGPSLSAKCLIVHLIHIVKICNGLPHFSMSLCPLVQSQNATPVNSVRNKWGTSVAIHCIHLFHLLHLLKSLWPSVTIFLWPNISHKKQGRIKLVLLFQDTAKNSVLPLPVLVKNKLKKLSKPWSLKNGLCKILCPRNIQMTSRNNTNARIFRSV